MESHSSFALGKRKQGDTNERGDLRSYFSPLQKKLALPSTSSGGPVLLPEHNSSGTDDTSLSDIGLFVDSKKPRPDDHAIFNLLEHHWSPPAGYSFPYSTHKKGNTEERRFVRKDHLQQYPWLVISPSKKGLFCKYCPFFAKETTQNGKTIRLGHLVKEPLMKFSKLLGKQGDLETHQNTSYHKEAVQRAADFVSTLKSPEDKISNQLDTYKIQQVKENRAKLDLIIKNVIFLGRQNIAFRGHRDDGRVSLEEQSTNDGNFRALLRFRCDVGDTALEEHLKTAGQRSMFTSKTVQNSLINCCGQEVLQTILCKVKEAKLFSCMFDETVDLAHISQMSLILRYVTVVGNEIKIREDFVGFLDLRKTVMELDTNHSSESEDDDQEMDAGNQIEPTVTGVKLGQVVVRELKSLGLDLKNCIGIGTDGVALNISETVGAVQEIQKVATNAVRCPCYNHQLNLAISKTVKVQSVRNAFGIMGEVITFFNMSSKRNMILKNVLKGQLTRLCDTRWVERHDAVLQFLTNIEGISTALETVSNWSDVAGDASPPKAKSLLCSITDGEFIVALCSLSELLVLTHNLSILFQTESIDVHTASDALFSVRSVLVSKRANVEEDFITVYGKSTEIANTLGTEIKTPRIVQTQRNRSNAPFSSCEEYYRRNIYVPLLDWILDDLHTRFPDDVLDVYKLNVFLPQTIVAGSVLHNPGPGVLEEDFKTLSKKYAKVCDMAEDVFTIKLKAEHSLWRSKWDRELDNGGSIPQSAVNAFDACHPILFPLIKTMLKILLTLPVSVASAERSFSTLRLLKTYLRSRSGEERLNGLAMMYIHREIPIDRHNVIDRFGRKNSRRKAKFIM